MSLYLYMPSMRVDETPGRPAPSRLDEWEKRMSQVPSVSERVFEDVALGKNSPKNPFSLPSKFKMVQGPYLNGRGDELVASLREELDPILREKGELV